MSTSHAHTAAGGHAHSASNSSAVGGSTNTFKEGVSAPRRTLGSGSNTELRAQIRRERRLQQQQQPQQQQQQVQQVQHHSQQPTSAAGATGTSASLATSSHNVGATASANPSRPNSALSTRHSSAATTSNHTTTTAATSHQYQSRRTASASSVTGQAPLRSTSSNVSQSSAGAGMVRASSQQQHHLHPPPVPLTGRNSQERVNDQQYYQQDHTAFSTVSQASTHGHGSAHGRSSSQGYAPSQQHTQRLEPPANAWPAQLEPELHSSVIDAIIANFQTKYAEAALKCKDWQAYAAKLKTQSRALGVENRLLRQLNERHQEQIQILKLQLDTASDERDRIDVERTRLENRVDELEALLMSQGQAHLRTHSGGSNFGRALPQQAFVGGGVGGQEYEQAHHPRRSTAPSPALSHSVDISHRQIRNGPARLQAARLMQQQQHQQQQQQQLQAQQGAHLCFPHLRNTSRSAEDADPSELFQTALDAATAAFETGLELSVPSVPPHWDGDGEDSRYADENLAPLAPSGRAGGPASASHVRSLRRSGTLYVPGSRAQASRSGSQRSSMVQRDHQGRLVGGSGGDDDDDDDEDSTDSFESESESESERLAASRRGPAGLSRLSTEAVASIAQLPRDGSPRPPTPTGYHVARVESSGARSIPSPEDTNSHATATQQTDSPAHGRGVPMHMHSSPPFQYQGQGQGVGTSRGHHIRSNAHAHQASLMAAVAATQHGGLDRGRRSQAVPVAAAADEEPPALMSPPPPSPIFIRSDSEHDPESGRVSPADILALDAERRDEVGPSPLIAYVDSVDNPLYAEMMEYDEARFATGSPMAHGAGANHGLGLKIGPGAGLGAGAGGTIELNAHAYQPLRLDHALAPATAPLGLPASDSHQTLVNGENEEKCVSEVGKTATAAPVSGSTRASASVMSNGAQRYTVISPARTRSSNSMNAGIGGAQGSKLTFSAIAPPPAAAAGSQDALGASAGGAQLVAEPPKRAAGPPPVTSMGGKGSTTTNSTSGHIARKRSSNSTDADLARSSASVPSLPFLPASQSAPAGGGLTDVTNLHGRHAMASQSFAMGGGGGGGGLVPPGQQQAGRPRAQSTLSEAGTVKGGGGLGAETAHDEDENEQPSRPLSLNFPMPPRAANLRLGSQGPLAHSLAGHAGNTTAPQLLQRPPSRSGSRNSNLSIASYQPVVASNGGGTHTTANASANAAAAAGIANRTSAGTLSVHSLGGEQLARARNRSRASSHSVHDAIPVVVKDDVFSDAGEHGVGGAAGEGSSGGLTPTGRTPSPLFGGAAAPGMGAGSNASTVGSSHGAFSHAGTLPTSNSNPDMQSTGPHSNGSSVGAPSQHVVRSSTDRRGQAGADLGGHAHATSQQQAQQYHHHHQQGIHSGVSGGPNASALLSEGGDVEDGYEDGEAEGVGPHRRLYARLRATLEPSHLAKLEKYVHRYDALDIPLEGPRGLINRVRKLLLRGEPDLADKPERLRLMKELLREFEALVRVEIPAPATGPGAGA